MGDGRLTGEQLRARYWEFILGCAVNKTKNLNDAADLAQETFLRAFGRVEEARTEREVKGYLVHVMTSVLADMYRKGPLPMQLEAICDPAIRDPSEMSHEFVEGLWYCILPHVFELPGKPGEIILDYLELRDVEAVARKREVRADYITRVLYRTCAKFRDIFNWNEWIGTDRAYKYQDVNWAEAFIGGLRPTASVSEDAEERASFWKKVYRRMRPVIRAQTDTVMWHGYAYRLPEHSCLRVEYLLTAAENMLREVPAGIESFGRRMGWNSEQRRKEILDTVDITRSEIVANVIKGFRFHRDKPPSYGRVCSRWEEYCQKIRRLRLGYE